MHLFLDQILLLVLNATPFDMELARSLVLVCRFTRDTVFYAYQATCTELLMRVFRTDRAKFIAFHNAFTGVVPLPLDVPSYVVWQLMYNRFWTKNRDLEETGRHVVWNDFDARDQVRPGIPNDLVRPCLRHLLFFYDEDEFGLDGLPERDIEREVRNMDGIDWVGGMLYVCPRRYMRDGRRVHTYHTVAEGRPAEPTAARNRCNDMLFECIDIAGERWQVPQEYNRQRRATGRDWALRLTELVCDTWKYNGKGLTSLTGTQGIVSLSVSNVIVDMFVMWHVGLRRLESHMDWYDKHVARLPPCQRFDIWKP